MKRGHLFILLVEDDENDLLFFHRATKANSLGHTVNEVRNGEEAIHYLRGEGQYRDRMKFPVPNVIMADLKMPYMGGFEFLRWLREHPECAIIPTIIFSSSSLEADVREAYRLGANSFFTKPAKLDDLIELLRSLYEYWSRCECPPLPRGC